MKSMLFTLAVVVILLAGTPPAQARTPDNLDQIQRETRIIADVLRSSLRNELRKQMRITSVAAQFLPRQGVLVSINMNAPWLRINDGENAIEINGDVTLSEIPAMVENILSDLHIDVDNYEPDAVAEVRELRAEQREVRQQQRDLRKSLREQRRELVRADDSDQRREIEQKISKLERELSASQVQYDSLAQDIEIQYQELKDLRGGSSKPKPAFDNDWDQLMARNACDYGPTLKGLRSDNYLTLALRRNDTTHYYTYLMEHINDCDKGKLRTDRLAELAYRYSN